LLLNIANKRTYKLAKIYGGEELYFTLKKKDNEFASWDIYTDKTLKKSACKIP